MKELHWSIKASFSAYVRRMPDGRVVVEDGAREQGGVFIFPSLRRNETTAFRGSVRFEGHDGLLRVEFREPALTWRGDRAAITIADSETPQGRLDLVSIGEMQTTPEGTLGLNITLTAEGSDLFFGPYAEGTPFDDLRITASGRRSAP